MIKGCSNLIYISLLLFYPYISISQSRILITSDFPGGNIEVLSIDDDTIRLKTDNSFTEGEWFYWYFRVSNMAGRKITFKFEQENVFARYGPAYSINNDQTWKWYGEKRIKENTFTFTFNEEDSIAYFSVACPYVEQNLMCVLSTVRNRVGLVVDSFCTSPEGCTSRRVGIRPVRRVPGRKVVITARALACEMWAS